MAEAFGGKGFRAKTLDELEEVLENELSCHNPCVIDCAIGMGENVLPMIPPGGSVKDIILK